MNWYVDSSVLVALGSSDALDHLTALDGRPVVLPTVRAEVETEPEATNLDRFCDRHDVEADDPDLDRALDVLGDSEPTGDAAVVGAVLARQRADDPVGVVADDRRVRNTARGLGATVTGTVGVVVRAVAVGELSAEDGKALVRHVDSRGFHMTGELRERAYELVEEAAHEDEE